MKKEAPQIQIPHLVFSAYNPETPCGYKGDDTTTNELLVRCPKCRMYIEMRRREKRLAR